MVARAPGRLDVMGGIADYSGSLVLQLPIAEATFAAAQRTGDGFVQVASLADGTDQPPRTLSLSCAEFGELAAAQYSLAGTRFRRKPEDAWAAYVVGAILVLARERRLDVGDGLRVLVRSHVPEAKGVSSSAALEVAVMQAVAGLWGVSVPGEEMARLCQVAENLVVGAPCGIMDQMTAAVGRENQLLALLCQPAQVQGFAPIPAPIRFWGIDSGIRHAVSGSDYTSVRTGAFMGYRMIAEFAGLELRTPDAEGVVTVTDPQWQGYLANLTPGEFEQRFADRLPKTMPGREFLDKYGGTTDAVTRVDPDRNYAIHQPTYHPIAEHARVRRFAELLASGLEDNAVRQMGELMYASHESYSACGLGSDGTDLLVQIIREAGPQSGLFGAKITGGGSGGTVAVLGRADAGDAVAALAGEYSRRTGRETFVFAGSSPGAAVSGSLEVACLARAASLH